MVKEKKLIILLIIVVIVMGLILLYKIKNPNTTKTISNIVNKKTAETNNIKTTSTVNNTVYIVSHKGETPSIKGIVKNGTNKTVKNVKVTADIYDENDNKISSSLDVINSLESNETWAFSIYASYSKYKYKNLKVTYNN